MADVLIIFPFRMGGKESLVRHARAQGLSVEVSGIFSNTFEKSIQAIINGLKNHRLVLTEVAPRESGIGPEWLSALAELPTQLKNRIVIEDFGQHKEELEQAGFQWILTAPSTGTVGYLQQILADPP